MRDEPAKVSEILLDWYDANARDLAWRVKPADSRGGLRPDPYRIWLSEVMLQQTTVAAVTAYFAAFTTRWPTVGALAAAADADVMAAWAGLGYYARARNLLKCARQVAALPGGEFPQTRDALIALPGIGPYTAAAIAAIAFDRSETVVDGNVERVMARLFAVKTPLPAVKPELYTLAAKLTPEHRAGDYAQAVMDLGATVCTPRNPDCGQCPLKSTCKAKALGIVASLPARSPKPAKPIRLGVAYIARRKDGAWLLERRPDRGLLGGMLGWPGSEWGETAEEEAPMIANWQSAVGEVRHTFTHFHLIMQIKVALVGNDAVPDTGEFINARSFRPSDLPTVMRKAYDLVSRLDFAN